MQCIGWYCPVALETAGSVDPHEFQVLTDVTILGIALKAATREGGKPIELTAEETRLLAQRLSKLADVLDSLVAQKRERAESGQ